MSTTAMQMKSFDGTPNESKEKIYIKKYTSFLRGQIDRMREKHALLEFKSTNEAKPSETNQKCIFRIGKTLKCSLRAFHLLQFFSHFFFRFSFYSHFKCNRRSSLQKKKNKLTALKMIHHFNRMTPAKTHFHFLRATNSGYSFVVQNKTEILLLINFSFGWTIFLWHLVSALQIFQTSFDGLVFLFSFRILLINNCRRPSNAINQSNEMGNDSGTDELQNE